MGIPSWLETKEWTIEEAKEQIDRLRDEEQYCRDQIEEIRSENPDTGGGREWKRERLRDMQNNLHEAMANRGYVRRVLTELIEAARQEREEERARRDQEREEERQQRDADRQQREAERQQREQARAERSRNESGSSDSGRDQRVPLERRVAQLENIVGQLRAELNALKSGVSAPTTDGRKSGVVGWFNSERGFGQLVDSSGVRVFVHHSAIQRGFVPSEGDKVEFDVVLRPKGPEARNVTRLAPHD